MNYELFTKAMLTASRCWLGAVTQCGDRLTDPVDAISRNDVIEVLCSGKQWHTYSKLVTFNEFYILKKKTFMMSLFSYCFRVNTSPFRLRDETHDVFRSKQEQSKIIMFFFTGE